MLWVALYFSDFALQLAQRADAGDRPTVVADGPATRPWVGSRNAGAAEAGVAPGMTLAAARALIRDLVVLQRDPVAESAALEGIACWAGQFTPSVAIEPQRGVLLEVATTLRMHGGLAALLTQLRPGLRRLGYRASIGVAPTPLAAWLFARARHAGQPGRTCVSCDALPAQLADVSLALLDWPDDRLRTLATLGIRDFGACAALPRKSFARRFGTAPRHDIDRALGLAPDPRSWYLPPERFSRALDFGFEVQDALALLFPLNRLLTELEGWLRARGAGVLEWRLVLVHSRNGESTLMIGSATPQRHAAHLLSLARERLARFTPPASALGLRISVERIHAYEAASESWVPDPAKNSADFSRMLDRLTARLGPNKVYRLQPCDEHRPDRSTRRIPATGPMATEKVPLITAPRPLWLLPAPRALLTENAMPRCRGALTLIAGPERLESGWWDGRPASRDYYVARNPHGETYWVFREHRSDAAWFLHGVFG